MKDSNTMYGTTILCVNKKTKTTNHLIIIADGQVSLGNTVMKSTAHKVKRLKNDIICGFAGSTAAAFTLLDGLNKSLAKYSDNLEKSCVELAKSMREEKSNMEAMIIVANNKNLFILTGAGDVLKPEVYTFKNCEFSVAAIGSGGNFALSAAMALCNTWKDINLKSGHSLSVSEVAKSAMQIAANICIYSNDNFVFEEIKEDFLKIKDIKSIEGKKDKKYH